MCVNFVKYCLFTLVLCLVGNTIGGEKPECQLNFVRGEELPINELPKVIAPGAIRFKDPSMKADRVICSRILRTHPGKSIYTVQYMNNQNKDCIAIVSVYTSGHLSADDLTCV